VGNVPFLLANATFFARQGRRAGGVPALMAMLCNGKCLKMVEFAGFFRDIHGARA
jgi:hypothetical protein